MSFNNDSGPIRFNVSKDSPCPICGKANWCRTTQDRLVVMCRRAKSHSVFRPIREKTDSNGAPYWVYHLEEDSYPLKQRPILLSDAEIFPGPNEGKSDSVRDWHEEANRHAKYLNRRPTIRNELAHKLGLPARCLAAVDLIGCNAVSTSGSSFTLPERDGREKIVGLSVRRPPKRDEDGIPDSGKEFIAGGHRGLTIPIGWRDDAGPILIVEGASDVLACAAAGLHAIGRPSNVGGSIFLAELLNDAPAEREIIVVGEGDRKPDGNWPGRRGAYCTAIKLARELNRPIGWAMVRKEDGKDARGFLTSRVKPEDSPERWEAVGQLMLEALRADRHFALPGMLYSLDRVFQGGRPPCGVTVELVGKKGTKSHGLNAAAHRPCECWTCEYCREWQKDKKSNWLFGVIGSWCDPDRLPDGMPEFEGAPSEEFAGPWRMYSAVIDANKWDSFDQKMKRTAEKYPGGIEYCRIEIDGRALSDLGPEEAASAYPLVYKDKDSTPYRLTGTRWLILLVGIAPEAVPTKGLRPISTDDAIRMGGEGLSLLPDKPCEGKKRLRPVNFSKGWKPREDDEDLGPAQWERDGIAVHRPQEMMKLLPQLGVTEMGELYKVYEPATSAKWPEYQLGGDLNAWLFRRLTCAINPLSRKPIEQSDIVRLYRSWSKFLSEMTPPIAFGSLTTKAIIDRLYAEPLPSDMEAIRNAEQQDADLGPTVDSDYDLDFWPSTG